MVAEVSFVIAIIVSLISVFLAGVVLTTLEALRTAETKLDESSNLLASENQKFCEDLKKASEANASYDAAIRNIDKKIENLKTRLSADHSARDRFSWQN